VAKLKMSEIRDLPVEEINQKLTETKEELFNLRFQNATGQLDNYKRLGELKRDVARIKGILRERELAGIDAGTEG
jgi:large subunit ribosomal protein L29